MPKYIENRFGILEDPFRLTPDPEYSYSHDIYKKALAYLEYALQRSEGFFVVTGQPGTGKTTLIRSLLNTLDTPDYVVVSLSTMALERDDLLRIVAQSLGCNISGKYRSEILVDLKATLEELINSGKKPVLIIDEAQGLSDEALEEIRLLSNFQQGNRLILQILLVGQEGVLKLIEKPHLDNLRQRIIAATALSPLDYTETAEYILYRLKHAGWTGVPKITSGTLAQIYMYSRGVPRLINLISSRILLFAVADDLDCVEEDDAIEVIEGLIEEGILGREKKLAGIGEQERRQVENLMGEIVPPPVLYERDTIPAPVDMDTLEEREDSNQPYISEIHVDEAVVEEKKTTKQMPIADVIEARYASIGGNPAPIVEERTSRRRASPARNILLLVLVLVIAFFGFLYAMTPGFNMDALLDRFFRNTEKTATVGMEKTDMAPPQPVVEVTTAKDANSQQHPDASQEVSPGLPFPGTGSGAEAMNSSSQVTAAGQDQNQPEAQAPVAGGTTEGMRNMGQEQNQAESQAPIAVAPVESMRKMDQADTVARQQGEIEAQISGIGNSADGMKDTNQSSAIHVQDGTEAQVPSAEGFDGMKSTGQADVPGSSDNAGQVNVQASPGTAQTNTAEPAPVPLSAEEKYLFTSDAPARHERFDSPGVQAPSSFGGIPGMKVEFVNTAILSGNWMYDGSGSMILPSLNSKCYPQDNGDMKCIGRMKGVLKVISYIRFNNNDPGIFSVRYARLDEKDGVDVTSYDLSITQSDAPMVHCKLVTIDEMVCINRASHLIKYHNDNTAQNRLAE